MMTKYECHVCDPSQERPCTVSVGVQDNTDLFPTKCPFLNNTKPEFVQVVQGVEVKAFLSEDTVLGIAYDESKEMVTVCDKCLRVSCWHGIFMCDDNKSAGTKQMLKSDVIKLGEENTCYIVTDKEFAERIKS